MPVAATLPRLREVARSLPSSNLPRGQSAGREREQQYVGPRWCLPCDFTLFTPTIFLRNLGKGDDLPMAARAGEIWACSWSSGRSQALWKMKAIRIFLPHLRNESTYLHVSCGQFKAGTGKEIGGLKPTSVSQMNTTNPWACFTLRNKGGTVGLGKS